MLVNIANAQADAKVDVNVIIVNDLYEESLLNCFNQRVTVHLIQRHYQSKELWFAVKLNRLLVSLSPDIIHIHDSRLFGLLWHKHLRHVVFLTLHDLPRGLVSRECLLFRLLPILNLSNDGNVTWIDKIPFVFSISQAVKEKLLSDYGTDSMLVCNGIKTKSFRQREPKMYERKLRIVQVSRLEHDKKGQDLLIEAVARLQGRAVVDFIGNGNSREYLANLVKEKGLRESVHFLGAEPQEFITEHLADYDLFVQPSRYEGFCLTVAEAMASNVPVLVSTGQGPAEVTCGNKYGWIFENGSADDLSNKIVFIIEHYTEALKKAERALGYVNNTYDVSVTARKYIEQYEMICSKRTSTIEK